MSSGWLPKQGKYRAAKARKKKRKVAYNFRALRRGCKLVDDSLDAQFGKDPSRFEGPWTNT